MRGFLRRLSLWALCICLMGLPVMTTLAAPAENCPGNCTHQAAIGTTHYDTLEEAIEAASEGSTVTLLTDITAQPSLSIEKAMALDLGGKTLSGQNTSTEGLLTVYKDLTVQNGTLTTGAGACLHVQDGNLTIEENANILATGESMALAIEHFSPVIMSLQSSDAQICATIKGSLSNEYDYPAVAALSTDGRSVHLIIKETASITSQGGNAIEMIGSGKLTVSGGSFQAQDHAVVWDISTGDGVEAAISGGNFTTEKETFVITREDGEPALAGFVTGGTYNQDPSAYIPDTCDVIDNGDGTYTVISAYTLTFQSGGASGTMEPVTVPCGESFRLPQCGYTPRENMDFAGWEIGGKTYAAGASFTPEGNTLITALWKEHVHYGGYATCLSPAVCTGCGSTYGQYGGHDLSSSGGYAATCDTPGMRQHSVCSTCGVSFVDGVETSTFSLSTPALGHQWKTEKEKPATCTEAGNKEHRVCSVCGTMQVDGKDVEKASVVIPALGHTLKTVAATQASCAQPGVQAHEHCTTCNQLFQQGKAVELTQLTTALSSHVLGDSWLNNETHHWKSCVDCDEVFRRDQHADKDADGACDDCGLAMAVSQPDAAQESTGFSVGFLIPILAAVGICVPLIIKTSKKRK